MSQREIEVSVVGQVGRIAIVRPETMNALRRTTFEALRAAIAELAADRGVRALVLTGTGRAFCSGADLSDPMLGGHLPREQRAAACAETLGGLMNGLVRELREVVQQTPDPLTAVRKGLRRYVEFGLEHPQRYLATFVVPHGQGPEIEDRYKDPTTMSMEAFSFLPRLVEECVRQKKIGKVDPHAASCALWAGVHGITSLLIVMPGFEWRDQDRVVDQLVTLLIEGLRVSKS